MHYCVVFGGNNGGGQTNVGGTGGQNGPVTGQGTGVAKPSAGIFLKAYLSTQIYEYKKLTCIKFIRWSWYRSWHRSSNSISNAQFIINSLIEALFNFLS